MSLTDPLFFAFVLFAAAVIEPLRGRLREGALLIASLIFAASQFSTLLSAVPVAVFVAGAYLATALITRRRGNAALMMTIAMLVFGFVWLKHYPFVAALPVLPFPYLLVGLSYILFRALHVAIEVADGALKLPDPLRYVTYLLFFPSFLSGPINRFEPFARDLEAPQQMTAAASYAVLMRFLIGMLKVKVIGDLLGMAHDGLAGRLDMALAAGGGMTSVAVLYGAAAASYVVFLYFNFSGFMDIAIAVARLFGIELPENFNRPFLATNLQEFWTRWHITLSEWFKIYFFNPLVKVLIRRWPNPRATPYLGVVALFAVFLVLGAWHGPTWGFLISGLLHAIGISANKLFQLEIVRAIGKKRYRAFAANGAYVWSSRGLTLTWVALAITAYWLPLDAFGGTMARLTPIGFLLCMMLMTLMFAIGIWTVLFCGRLFSFSRFASWSLGAPVRQAGSAAAAILVLAFAIPLLNSTTEVVYKAF